MKYHKAQIHLLAPIPPVELVLSVWKLPGFQVNLNQLVISAQMLSGGDMKLGGPGKFVQPKETPNHWPCPRSLFQL